MTKASVYLDWNASAPLRKEARAAMLSAMDAVGNPSSVHSHGRAAKAAIETARAQVAEACGADPHSVVFTSGATEAVALALSKRDLSSAWIEHDAVLAWTKPVLPVDDRGLVSVAQPETSTLQIANSETGIVQSIPDGLAVTDATQAFGKLPVAEQISKAGAAAISAHKAGGPKGVGALIARNPSEIEAVIRGGGQESGHRSGTENVAGIAGFGAAAAAAAAEVANGLWEELAELRDELEDALFDAAPDLVVFGQDSERLPNTSCFAVPGWKGETQVMQMDLDGHSVSAGSACSSGKVRPSRVIEALGGSELAARSAIRISFGPLTGREELLRFARGWTRNHRRFRERRAVSAEGKAMAGV